MVWNTGRTEQDERALTNQKWRPQCARTLSVDSDNDSRHILKLLVVDRRSRLQSAQIRDL
jgi:hypothetical protein